MTLFKMLKYNRYHSRLTDGGRGRTVVIDGKIPLFTSRLGLIAYKRAMHGRGVDESNAFAEEFTGKVTKRYIVDPKPD